MTPIVLALALLIGQQAPTPPNHRMRDDYKPPIPQVTLPVGLIVDVGQPFASVFAARRNRIWILEAKALVVKDWAGKEIARTPLNPLDVARWDKGLTVDPDGTVWIAGDKGEIKVAPNAKPEMTKIRSQNFGFNEISCYAGKDKRWIVQRPPNLALIDESGKVLKVVQTHKGKTLFGIESLDSSDSGSVAMLSHEGGKHFVKIFAASGGQIHRFEVPVPPRSWEILPISFDGERVLIQRHEGLYCFSKDGKPLWYAPHEMSTAQPGVWMGTLQARFVKGMKAIAVLNTSVKTSLSGQSHMVTIFNPPKMTKP